MNATVQFSPDFVYWSFLRFELRHNLRQARIDPHGHTAWDALKTAERTQTRLRWHPELNANSLIEASDEFSAQHALAFGAGSSDLLHVCAARRLNLLSELDSFWTCDREQANAAKAAGLKIRLFQLAK